MINKVYAILHRSYEFDDLNYGDLTPLFLSLDKDKVINKFNSIKIEEINNFNKNMDNYYNEFIKEYPERTEDFQIVENTDNHLEIYFNNWCYE